MKNNIVRKIVSIGIVVVLLLGITACDKKKSVSLVDFSDETITVVLGTQYNVDLSDVKDSGGNSYSVTASVKTASGDSVVILRDKFDVVDHGGYVITYTAHIEGGNKSRKVTVLVKDEGAPIIRFGNAKAIGEVSIPYKLPAYEITDPEGNEFTNTAKLYLLSGETATEKEFDAQTSIFVPAEEGEYEYRVAAKDALSNEAFKPFAFYVRKTPNLAEVESFDTPSSLSNAMTHGWAEGGLNASLSYESGDIDGITGSLKMITDQGFPRFCVNPRKAKDSYSGYKYIAFKLYIKPETVAKDHLYKIISTVNNTYNVPVGRWVEVVVECEKFFKQEPLNNYYELFMIYNDTNAQHAYRHEDNGLTLHVSDIRATNSQSTVSGSALIDLSNSNVVTNFKIGVDWNKTPIGHSIQKINDLDVGVIRIAVSSVDPQAKFYINPGRAFAEAADYKNIEFSINIDEKSVASGRKEKIVKTIDGVSHTVKVGTWVTFTIPTKALYKADGDYKEAFYILNSGADLDANFEYCIKSVELKDFSIEPKIIFGEAEKTSVTNIAYQLPTYSVEGRVVGNPKEQLILVGSPDQIIQFDADTDKFTPNVAGSYKYVITVKDAANKEYDGVFSFIIGRATNANELEKFDDAAGIINASVSGFAIAHEPKTILGVTGSAKLTLLEDSSWPTFDIRPRKSKESYSAYDQIVFKMFIEPTSVGENHLKTLNTAERNIVVRPGAWAEVMINRESFFNQSETDGYYRLFRLANDGAAGETFREKDSAIIIYISDVRGVKKQTTTLANDGAKLLDFATPDVSIQVKTTSPYNYAVDYRNIGNKNAIGMLFRFTNGSWDFGQIDIGRTTAEMTGYTHVSLKIWVDSASLTDGIAIKDKIYLETIGMVNADQWHEIQIPVSDFATAGYVNVFRFPNDGENFGRTKNLNPLIYISDVVLIAK